MRNELAVSAASSPTKPLIEIVCLRYPPAVGGTEQYVASIANRLAGSMQVGVRIQTTDHGLSSKAAEIPVHDRSSDPEIHRHHCVTGRSTGRYPIAPGLFAALVRSEADLLHAFGQHLFTTDAAHMASRLRRRPLVVSPLYHPVQSVLGRVHQRTLGRWLARAEVVVAISSFELETLRKNGLSWRRATIVPPVPRSFPSPDPSIWERIGIDPTQVPVVLGVGRAARHKGFDQLVAAIGRLGSRVPDLVCCLVGPGQGARQTAGDSGLLYPHRNEFSRLVALGAVSDAELAALYENARVVVLPSSYETFGLVLLEALAAGTPALGPDVGGPGELLAEYPPLVFRVGDPVDLAARLADLLEDGQIRQGALAWAREHLLPRFTSERQLSCLLESYAWAGLSL